MVENNSLKVNFSDEESSSETRTFQAMPSGFYLAAITKVEDAAVTNNDKGNFGKPFWKITLVVQEGTFAKRNLWTNVMLFEGALHSAAQLLKATGFGDMVKKGQIPNGQLLVGKTLDVNVARKRDKYQEDALREVGDNGVVFKNEVKGYRAHDAAATGGASSSLLPG